MSTTTKTQLAAGDRVRHARFTEFEGTVRHVSARLDDVTVTWASGQTVDGYAAEELERIESKGAQR